DPPVAVRRAAGLRGRDGRRRGAAAGGGAAGGGPDGGCGVSPRMIVLLIRIPLAGAALGAFGSGRNAYRDALAASVASLVPAAVMLFQFDYARSAEFQGLGRLEWLPQLGLELSVGLDSVALLLVGLTVLLGPVCVMASKTA